MHTGSAEARAVPSLGKGVSQLLSGSDLCVLPAQGPEPCQLSLVPLLGLGTAPEALACRCSYLVFGSFSGGGTVNVHFGLVVISQ